MTYRDRRPDVRQEEDHVSARGLLLAGFATTIFGVALAVWAASLAHSQEASLRPSGKFPERDLQMPPLVSDVHQRVFGTSVTGESFDAPRLKQLSRYGWVDDSHKSARVPIDVAKRIVVEKAGAR